MSPRNLLHRARRVGFVALLLTVAVLVALVSERYYAIVDVSANQRGSLSVASEELLARLNDRELQFTLLVSQGSRVLRDQGEQLLARYQRAGPAQVEIEIADPNLEPERMRRLGIDTDGSLLVTMLGGANDGATEVVRPPLNEARVSSALKRLLRGDSRRVAFLAGHGERAFDTDKGPAYSDFVARLEDQGFVVSRVNLLQSPKLPEELAVLVIAGPTAAPLGGELATIIDYWRRGGAILWLQDPGAATGYAELGEAVGVRLLTGTVVDANVDLQALLGIRSPAAVPVVEFAAHPITEGLTTAAIFPFARALRAHPEAGPMGIRGETFLRTLPRTWVETESLVGDVRFDRDSADVEGPVALGYRWAPPQRAPDPGPNDGDPAAAASTTGSAAGDPVRPSGRDDAPGPTHSAQGAETRTDRAEDEGRPGRVVVIGDSDFLANAYLGAGSNLALGTNLLDWLASDDELVGIPPRPARDRQLDLTMVELGLVGFGFLLVLPAGLLLGGVLTWLVRRRG